ncbi:2598_t:CDS:1, partial [Gigaspora rosea]
EEITEMDDITTKAKEMTLAMKITNINEERASNNNTSDETVTEEKINK